MNIIISRAITKLEANIIFQRYQGNKGIINWIANPKDSPKESEKNIQIEIYMGHVRQKESTK